MPKDRKFQLGPTVWCPAPPFHVYPWPWVRNETQMDRQAQCIEADSTLCQVLPTHAWSTTVGEDPRRLIKHQFFLDLCPPLHFGILEWCLGKEISRKSLQDETTFSLQGQNQPASLQSPVGSEHGSKTGRNFRVARTESIKPNSSLF